MSNTYLKKYVPSLTKIVGTQSKEVNRIDRENKRQSAAMKEITKEHKNLSNAWLNEQEKTNNMQELLSSLFVEFHDAEMQQQ